MDHYLVLRASKVNAWRIKKRRAKQKLVESRTMKKYDKSLFLYDLQQIDWETILAPFADDPSAMAGTFQEIFESLLNIHAPIKEQG